LVDIRQRWTAAGIQWKIDEEEKFILSQEERRILNKEKEQEVAKSITPSIIFDVSETPYQYIRGDYRFNLDDSHMLNKYITISYCYDDKEICRSIYDSLKKSEFYQLWMNKHYTYSTNPIIIAQEIEKSDVVIMCFSSKYRESPVCRLEAEYAQKRKRPIIPVRIEGRYDPSGWLDDIIGQKEYIDFTKSDFDTACNALTKEINHIRRKID
jgi:hypothetical protein